jgi:membrane protease YdiL (CAAX protease family)
MKQSYPSYLAFFSVLSVIVLFLFYYLLRRSKILTGLFDSIKHDQVFTNFTEKITGFLLFGIIPFLLFVSLADLLPAETGLTKGNSGQYLYIFLPILMLVTIITFFSSRNKRMQMICPQPRIKTWTLKYLTVSIFGWVIYILGYEFFIRGVLWFTCFRAFGPGPALIINVALYALVHLGQGKEMILGAIPLGLIFCLITWLTGSILFAFILHSWIAISMDIFSIYNNQDLKFGLNLKENEL